MVSVVNSKRRLTKVITDGDKSTMTLEKSSISITNKYSNVSARSYALLLLMTVYSANFIDRQLLSILQEPIKIELNLSDGQLGVLTGVSFAFFYVLAGIPIARYADRGNRRNVIAYSVGVWSLMTAVSGAALNYFHLLLARIGVGIGEAGCSPPAHSIISDIFPPKKRASAIAFYSMGVNIGILFGFLFGGWLNEYFGWRVAFVVVGLPGILLAVLVRTTLAEPIRGHHEDKKLASSRVSFIDVLSLLWSRLSFRHMCFAASLSAFAGNSSNSWTASFMMRSHGMSSGELGTWLAMIVGLGGAIGVLGGGLLADKLASRDRRWYLWLPAIANLACVPFLVAVYSVDNAYTALLLSVIPGLLFNVYLGTTIATTQSLVGLRMRATASAILMLIANIIGLGLGPLSVGILSDYLLPSYGTDSLKQAMLILLPFFMCWSSLHFYRGSIDLEHDLDAAPD